ncbi:hypothetical protein QN277_011114 [Acacia crassicarpa]|uniref:Uncharacterized protein n=1 Tax=Acacia crassicarpa TaxID=499986 RepID=A0AAE1MY12_9FABA|nr:hypothetical protein QN277_011114 [Acacia crassicarpa]
MKLRKLPIISRRKLNNLTKRIWQIDRSMGVERDQELTGLEQQQPRALIPSPNLESDRMS